MTSCEQSFCLLISSTSRPLFSWILKSKAWKSFFWVEPFIKDLYQHKVFNKRGCCLKKLQIVNLMLLFYRESKDLVRRYGLFVYL